MNVRAAALAWAASGTCVLPTKQDGSKSPDRTWRGYVHHPGNPIPAAPAVAIVDTWFTEASGGLGLILGAVSGNLEMIELEAAAVDEGLLARFRELMISNGLEELWSRLCSGYVERTPRGGLHFIYRVSDGVALPNTKLASRPATAGELAIDPQNRIRVLIETRGEGGYCIVAPSNGRTHPTGGAWVLTVGTPGVVISVSAAERDAMFAVARMLNTVAEVPRPLRSSASAFGSSMDDAFAPDHGGFAGVLSPLDDFEARADWADILLTAGWEFVDTQMGTSYWRRPGKDLGDSGWDHSASTGYWDERDCMYVWSTSTELPTGVWMTKGRVYAYLHHGGDMAEAARDLYAQGYGARREECSSSTSGSVTSSPAASSGSESAADGGGIVPGWFSGKGLRAVACADHLRGLAPVARTRESGVAVYADGVYRVNEAALRMVTIGMLGDRWTLAHHNTISTVVATQLYGQGRELPERMAEPLVNFTNGMLDLRTLAMRPHDPGYVSTFQLPFDWDPTAICPTYLCWVQMIDIAEQLVDLEETVGSMLDPSRTPSKALFVFGPARSGKSTYLRLMAAVVGPERTSGLSLQDLASDRFAAANLYGMVLNVCADLSAAHVEDVSLFKKLTGQDLIAANRKYGGQFTFTNSALFAFSGNTLPTVSESSRAYLERMKPVSFASSFAGAEDPSIEDAMMTELPGIVARWVRRYHERLVRGTPTPTLPRVAAQFAEASNRVRMWLATEVETSEGYWATTTTLYDSFKRWCDQEGGAKAMGRTKFAEQLRSSTLQERTNSVTKVRGWQAYPKPFSG